ncbi:MAG: acetylxylan esterase [Spirochaetaceae bacterium]|jgi:cephalosporin-C deacetylase|nr:acetylxylan esterase [Spirochaetaceae bacterium]
MLVDLRPEELFRWQGLNPRPKDHDAYWERALEELDAVRPEVALKPAAFTCSFADCFDLSFTGVRGARIHAKYVRPKKIAGTIPAVVSFHGYSGSAGDWSQFLPFAAEGIAVAAIDVRGQGGSSEDTGNAVRGNTLQGQIIRGLDDEPDNLLMRHIFLDTAQVVRVVAAFDEIDENRLGATGGSQGGGLTIACAALEPRIKRAFVRYPFLSDYKRVWELDLAKDAYTELQIYFKRFDPRHERADESFTRLGYIDVQFLAPRIKADFVMLTGLMDTVCPPSSQFAAYNKITANKRVFFYHDFGHEYLPDSDDMLFAFMKGL